MARRIPPGRRFSILDRFFKARINEHAKEYGLTAVQFRVLGCLSRLESYGVDEVNQKDLEQEEHLTHQTMTEIIKKLETKGFVICTVSETDRRYKKITCAPPYKEIHSRIAVADENVLKEICAGIDQQEIDQFFAITDKMLRNIGYDPNT